MVVEVAVVEVGAAIQGRQRVHSHFRLDRHVRLRGLVEVTLVVDTSSSDITITLTVFLDKMNFCVEKAAKYNFKIR